jgi:hypothetical protein
MAKLIGNQLFASKPHSYLWLAWIKWNEVEPGAQPKIKNDT